MAWKNDGAGWKKAKVVDAHGFKYEIQASPAGTFIVCEDIYGRVLLTTKNWSEVRTLLQDKGVNVR